MGPRLNLLEKNDKKLLNHQQFKPLFFGTCFRLQPLAAKFPEFAKSFMGSGQILMKELWKVSHSLLSNPSFHKGLRCPPFPTFTNTHPPLLGES